MLQRGRYHVVGNVQLDHWHDFQATMDLDFGAVLPVVDKCSNAAGIKARNLVHDFFLHARSRLSKFRGLREESVRLFLKESAFRFNAKDSTTFSALKLLLRTAPL
jgi:transposase-like protein